ncbi:MAG: alpha/beta hydrolase [Lachnospiraceae bacterium]|nr:alpha/beta hydrolase [Lachnospiraceae bacterium]
MKKLAIISPGIGYNKDKPLLYYATKLVKSLGYEVIHIEYKDLPADAKGDVAMMEKAAKVAFSQAEEQLKDIAFSDYEKVVFIGKSIGTVVIAAYVYYHKVKAAQVWYTPVEATFQFDPKDVTAFIGDADPFSDITIVKDKAKACGVKLYTYERCNHSLETGDVKVDIKNLGEVMKLTEDYLEV